MERIDRLRNSLFLRHDVFLTGHCLSALCFILGMIMLGIHAFVEKRESFTSVAELHNVPTTQISWALILLGIIAPLGERFQRVYINILLKRLSASTEPKE